MQIEKRLEELGISLPEGSDTGGELRDNRPNRESGVYVGTRSGHWRGQDL